MIWGIGYAVVALVVTGVSARRFAWGMRSDYGSGGLDDSFMALLFGATMGAAWPVSLPGALVVRWLAADVKRNHPEEVERRAREAEARVRELERELGIGTQREHAINLPHMSVDPIRPGSFRFKSGGVRPL